MKPGDIFRTQPKSAMSESAIFHTRASHLAVVLLAEPSSLRRWSCLRRIHDNMGHRALIVTIHKCSLSDPHPPRQPSLAWLAFARVAKMRVGRDRGVSLTVVVVCAYIITLLLQLQEDADDNLTPRLTSDPGGPHTARRTHVRTCAFAREPVHLRGCLGKTCTFSDYANYVRVAKGHACCWRRR